MKTKGHKKKCCNNCYAGKPCCKPEAVPLSGKFHTGGVTQLQYVGDADGLGGWSSVMPAVQFGLLAMGVACLLGLDRSTARMVGLAGVGYGFIKG